MKLDIELSGPDGSPIAMNEDHRIRWHRHEFRCPAPRALPAARRRTGSPFRGDPSSGLVRVPAPTDPEWAHLKQRYPLAQELGRETTSTLSTVGENLSMMVASVTSLKAIQDLDPTLWSPEGQVQVASVMKIAGEMESTGRLILNAAGLVADTSCEQGRRLRDLIIEFLQRPPGPLQSNVRGRRIGLMPYAVRALMEIGDSESRRAALQLIEEGFSSWNDDRKGEPR